jgi:hypothetical protein
MNAAREEALEAFRVATDALRPFLDKEMASRLKWLIMIVEIAVALREDK